MMGSTSGSASSMDWSTSCGSSAWTEAGMVVFEGISFRGRGEGIGGYEA
jgi:hypothetical protein